MNFDNKFPVHLSDSTGLAIFEIHQYLLELKNTLNGIEQTMHKIAKEELESYVNSISTDTMTLDDADEGFTLDDTEEGGDADAGVTGAE